MDPLTALELAGNIISFIDFSDKLIRRAHHVYSSATGTTVAVDDCTKAVEDLQVVTRRLGSRPYGPMTEDDVVLDSLIVGCRALSAELLEELGKFRMKNPSSKLQSFAAAWKSVVKAKELESMEGRVDSYRRRILDRVIIMMRYTLIPAHLYCGLAPNRVSAVRNSRHFAGFSTRPRESVGSLPRKLDKNLALYGIAF